jgi:imidazolonepropionase-like amidohydrolase
MKINRQIVIRAESKVHLLLGEKAGMRASLLPHTNIAARLLLSLLSIALVGSTRASAETIYLHNAIVHTVANGTITNGGVLISGSKIEQVTDGKSRERIIADKSIDLKGAHIYPGLIALDSALGLGEIEAVRATQDTTESGEGFTPDVRSWIAVNPDSELIPVSRANGITHAEPVPQGGFVAGLSGVVAFDGWTSEQMAIKKPAALHVYWPQMELSASPRGRGRGGPTPGGPKSVDEQAKDRSLKIKAIDDFFIEARNYAKARAAITNGAHDPGVNPPWEAMLPVVRGEVPLMIHANELRQIKSAVKWALSNHWQIVIVGARDAWQAPDLLATNKIPVIYEATWTQPERDFDPYDVHFKAPEALRKAGVTVAFSVGNSSFDVPMSKNLPYLAAQAVAFGLPEEDALKGLTLYPAQMLGIADRLGTIEPGREATLFVCDGNILDLRANVTHLWIAGHEESLASRHTRLYEKYKNRPLPK